ncbi:MAG: helix-turn-helix domain-containing protein [Desulfovibrionaceae bacterium]|nr:helix-turn-helix domain-containing protein [Desulfovibrionaceae bacterium]MBF0514556.1 helix-turn-helix domain-containing protein [Desulfovibrionaceae bacterium]
MNTSKISLARELGITPQHLNAVLRGRVKPSAALAVKLETRAGVPKESLRPDIFSLEHGQPVAAPADANPEEAA